MVGLRSRNFDIENVIIYKKKTFMEARINYEKM
jgi:hypothetical protein